MAHAKIILEDQEDGAIAFRAIFTDGEKKDSHAHKMVGQIIGFLDEQAAKKSQEATLAKPSGRILV